MAGYTQGTFFNVSLLDSETENQWDEVKALNEQAKPSPALGFNFNTSDLDLSTAIAQCKAVTDLTAIVKLHGIAMDGNGVAYDSVTEMLKANTEVAMANGGQQIVDAMVEQLTAHLEAQAK